MEFRISPTEQRAVEIVMAMQSESEEQAAVDGLAGVVEEMRANDEPQPTQTGPTTE
jgi:hypothetical protein